MELPITKAEDQREGAASLNELRGLVNRNAPATIDRLSTEFPEFAAELGKGLALGPEAERDDNRRFVERRGMLAMQLGKEVLRIVAQRIEQIRRQVTARRRRKIILLTLGGVSGAGTLGALGTSPEIAARIGAAVTSLVAIGNTIHEFLLRQGDENLSSVVSKLLKAQHVLTVYCEEIGAAVEEHIGLGQMTELINKANSVAEELSGEAAGLGV